MPTGTQKFTMYQLKPMGDICHFGADCRAGRHNDVDDADNVEEPRHVNEPQVPYRSG